MSESNWIPVTERLPQRGDANAAGEVLVRTTTGHEGLLKWSLVSAQTVAAWKALSMEQGARSMG